MLFALIMPSVHLCVQLIFLVPQLAALSIKLSNPAVEQLLLLTGPLCS